MRRVALFFLILSLSGFSTEPDWSREVKVREARSNIYQWPPDELKAVNRAGKLHALHYPVEITGVLPPRRPFERLLGFSHRNPIKRKFLSAFGIQDRIANPDQFYAWLGLSPYPEDPGTGAYEVPYPDGSQPAYRMGFTPMGTPDGAAMTFGCASCHGGSLFGRPILGLTNRFPRANSFFVSAKTMVKRIPPPLFQAALLTTAGERKMYERLRDNVRFLDSKQPLALGLDTSLAHTAISLSHRAPDPWGTKDPYFITHPTPEPLRTKAADSKPMVWWNAKYKTRWLSDGSMVSGNPILTNFFWNEIGRGTDLHQLDAWLDKSTETIRELTTTVFATEAPRFTDFFSRDHFELSKAQRGQSLFRQYCSGCHGDYLKAWEEATHMGDPLATLKVIYHEQTPVFDVGTDPGRYRGMNSLARRLNSLALSKKHGIQIEPQTGYVPPPLVGIWARWPYLHNNSIPSLCALLSPEDKRPATFYMGPAVLPDRDFDRTCNGYPLGSHTARAWRQEGFRFDTTREGLSNRGHFEQIFPNNPEGLPEDELMALIMFLQTL